jgi:hypothetical protein
MKAEAIAAARFKGDVELLDAARADSVLGRCLEDSAARHRRNVLRSRLLSHTEILGIRSQACDLLVAEYPKDDEGEDNGGE